MNNKTNHNILKIPILKPEGRPIIKAIISQYPYQFYVYGSRARGDCEEYSDLDLCIFQNFKVDEKIKIKESFSTSDLPIIVDIVSGNELSEDFKNQIKSDLIPLLG